MFINIKNITIPRKVWLSVAVSGGVVLAAGVIFALAMPKQAAQVASNAVKTIRSARLPVPGTGDTTVPTVSLTTPQNQLASSSKVSLTVTAADDVGVVRVKYLIDGKEAANTTANPFTVSIDFSKLSAGSHTLQVIAFDAAGNQGKTKEVSFTVPAKAPGATGKTGSAGKTGGAGGSSGSGGGTSSGGATGGSSGGGATGGSTGVCPLPKYPSPACTGVPAGTVLTDVPLDVDGNYVVTQNGATINARHVGGDLLIEANNVTITNSQIDGTVYNWYGNGNNNFTISDSTIGPANGCIGQPGIVEKSYVATRVYVRGHDDGFRVAEPGNVTVKDSYANLCYLPPNLAPPDGSHSDGIQAVCGSTCANILFQHNTIDARTVPATFMINLVDTHLSNVTATDNLLMGGAYTMVLEWYTGPNYVVSNNKVVNNSWAYGPASAEGTCANQSWTGNSIVTIDSNYNVTGTVSSLGCSN